MQKGWMIEMQGNRRFVIEKYLEMARITRREKKREYFIDMAQNHLESEEEIEVEALTEDTDEWISNCGKETFVMKPIKEAYDDYLSYALPNGIKVVTKNELSKRIKKEFGLDSKPIHANKKVQHTFYDPLKER